MTQARPLLVVFSGLPGTGKTTLSTILARRLGAFHLRIDVIEQAMQAAGIGQVGAAGYAVANALAEANLRLGRTIVADCVNPVHESRLGWSGAAARSSARIANIHLFCSDAAEHRRRVEKRAADIPGHLLPTWDAVMRHEFEERTDDHLALDTAAMSPAASALQCVAYVSGKPE